MINRAEKIREFRLKQDVEELKRKRDKAWRRDIWTQEDIDYAEVQAEIWHKFFNKDHDKSTCQR